MVYTQMTILFKCARIYTEFHIILNLLEQQVLSNAISFPWKTYISR